LEMHKTGELAEALGIHRAAAAIMTNLTAGISGNAHRVGAETQGAISRQCSGGRRFVGPLCASCAVLSARDP